jgi:hypothetical protein
MQNERVDLNILYYMIIRVEFNDERGHGVAREYDDCPSYDENVTNTRTHTYTHTEEYTGRKSCAVASSGRIKGATKFVGIKYIKLNNVIVALNKL